MPVAICFYRTFFRIQFMTQLYVPGRERYGGSGGVTGTPWASSGPSRRAFIEYYECLLTLLNPPTEKPLDSRHVLAVYLVLGIGADDLFVFYDAWIQSAMITDLEQRMGQGQAGPPAVVTRP